MCESSNDLSQSMRKRAILDLSLSFLIVATLLWPSLVHGDEVDEYIKLRMEKEHLPGLSLAILKDGSPLSSRDMDTLTLSSRFRLLQKPPIKLARSQNNLQQPRSCSSFRMVGSSWTGESANTSAARQKHGRTLPSAICSTT